MLLNEQLAVSAKPRLSVRVATETQDIRRAQKLRFDVFAGEMGAELNSRNSASIATSTTSCANT